MIRSIVAAFAASLIGLTPANATTRARDESLSFAIQAPATGASWYPEQWPEAQWESDLALMRRANITVVRVGEFAWARLEPGDGRFDFGWLDRAIAAAARHGIRVVIGTPTAAPPVWLSEAHPDILRVNEDGSIEGHGERRQFSFASATYRRYAVRIADELARRYGHNPAVVGWQIDNEIGVPSFDREAKARWAKWLSGRYGTIDALNRRWTTEYWSQRYERFDQIPLKSRGPQNPALLLDFRRFASALWAEYVAAQAAAIRAHADRRQFVTTNSTAWNNNFDQFLVHEVLDIAAWDDYVPNGRPDWAANALHHDLVRGYKSRNFWVMEAQPGRVDWGALNRSLEPGQVREIAWQAVGHGGDAVIYWQWRSAFNGQEQYHGTLIGPDGEPMPIYDEIARTGEEFARAAPHLAGTTVPRAEIALIYSQESRWAIENERHSRDYDPVAVLKDWYRPFAAKGYRIDVVPPGADLTGYRLVLAPNLNLIDESVAERLSTYVRGGGQLMLGPRSGMKDADNALWRQRQPGPLSALLGMQVEYYYPLDESAAITGPGGPATVLTWAEVLRPIAPDAEILARYTGGSGWLVGRPAIGARRAGRGSIIYVGAILDTNGQNGLSIWMAARAALSTPVIEPPAGVEVMERCNARTRYLILINHNDQPARIDLPTKGRAILGELRENELPAHGVGIWAISRER
ncbi:beta-galactosidase [Sphingomonas canadensis]|uniref:Beta-galactosidase n=1 Tax=Sphingomonas canadensis TaxID=1219257 RepID=A0ABW3H363_9SPHN|nr:beta-galactosidase [Sphingomonas canadensis]MCW3834788.1 beta-galactosidase [Sphingomonas canadensis]